MLVNWMYVSSNRVAKFKKWHITETKYFELNIKNLLEEQCTRIYKDQYYVIIQGRFYLQTFYAFGVKWNNY